MVLKLLLSMHESLLNRTDDILAWEERLADTHDDAAATHHSIVIRSTILSTTTQLSQQHAETGDGRIPTFEMVLGTVTYLIIILMTICGNILVILAVFTYQPLKKVQNYLLVSLAASDLAVAIVVMPLHVVKFLADGRWLLGVTVCQLFTTADILLCTSSILNLCAIALDRYWAIHDPIAYAQKRTLNFVCRMIVVVWSASLVISVPPLIGWNDWTSQKLMDHCELTTERAFVVFSASGSFFVPLAVMTVVYIKIYFAARQRIRTNRERSALSKIVKPQLPAAEANAHGPNNSLKPKEVKSRSKRPPPGQGRSAENRPSEHRSRSVLAMMTSTSAHIVRRPSFLFRQRAKSHSLSHTAPAGTTSIFDIFTERRRNRNCSNSNGTADGTNPTPSAISFHAAPSEAIDSGVSTTVVTITNGEAGTPVADAKGDLVPPTLFDRPPSPFPAQRKGSAKTSKGVHHARFSTATTPETADKLTVPAPAPQSLDPTAALKQREKISVAKEKRAAKTIAVIIFCFVGCWMPFFIAYVVLPFCESCSIHPKILQAFVWLGYINSSLNPVLYGILNCEFRRAFKRILCPTGNSSGGQIRSVRRRSNR